MGFKTARNPAEYDRKSETRRAKEMPARERQRIRTSLTKLTFQPSHTLYQIVLSLYVRFLLHQAIVLAIVSYPVRKGKAPVASLTIPASRISVSIESISGCRESKETGHSEHVTSCSSTRCSCIAPLPRSKGTMYSGFQQDSPFG